MSDLLEDDFDDGLPATPEKPDWRRESKGVWAVRLSQGDYATVTFDAASDTWLAEVLRVGKVTKRSAKDFNESVAWAEGQLFPRRTAWDRIKAV